MYCPEHLVFKCDRLQIWVWHWQSVDVPREFISWAEVLNPLRYEITFGRRFVINSGAHWNRRYRNFRFAIFGRRT